MFCFPQMAGKVVRFFSSIYYNQYKLPLVYDELPAVYKVMDVISGACRNNPTADEMVLLFNFHAGLVRFGLAGGRFLCAVRVVVAVVCAGCLSPPLSPFHCLVLFCFDLFPSLPPPHIFLLHPPSAISLPSLLPPFGLPCPPLSLSSFP